MGGLPLQSPPFGVTSTEVAIGYSRQIITTKRVNTTWPRLVLVARETKLPEKVIHYGRNLANHLENPTRYERSPPKKPYTRMNWKKALRK